MLRILFFLIIFLSTNVFAKGYDVFAIGYYDIKFDGSQTNEAVDFRYERRFDNSLIQIGPDSYDFFDLKPFAGIEVQSTGGMPLGCKKQLLLFLTIRM